MLHDVEAMDRGVVAFVGLTPGDPGVNAASASDRIARADVVLSDPYEGGPPRLVECARQGQRVVRSVIGDPFDHAHVVDEMRAVAAAGVALEVLPGVGASQAASAFAGVVGRAVRARASDVGQAVEGMPLDQPVTLIAAAGSPAQRVRVTTVRGASIAAGPWGGESVVVAFGVPEDRLRWFERRALFGKRILVTRAERQAGVTAGLLRELGADPVLMPAIEFSPPSDKVPLARALVELRAGAYAWVAFTSTNGVDETWKTLVQSGGDARAFGRSRLAAIGPATARALEAHGLVADVVAKEYRGEGLAKELLEALAWGGTEARVLLPRASKARDVLPRMLREGGVRVDVVAAYETRGPAQRDLAGLAENLESGRIDVVLFTSSSTVENLCASLGARSAALLARTRVACIGPVTTETAVAHGVRVDVTAREFTVAGLVSALAESYGRAEL
ncbi:MAG: uroporphyrinogen-III synthase [Polyangiaceae bacterium]|jgi:uroporphyrinogen III methyltransferase/synthase